MTEYGEPAWNEAPSRVINNEIEAYMPFSPTSTPREAVIMRTFSSLMEVDPQFDVDNDLQAAVKNLQQLDDDRELADEMWDAFASAYVTTGEKGTWDPNANANSYIIPFHSKIPRHLESGERRDWGSFYTMLMTDGRVAGFNQELHRTFKSKYTALNPSNTLEEVIIWAINELTEGTEDTDGPDPNSDESQLAITPYVPDMSTVFQQDLRNWLGMLDDEPTAMWLQTLKDLVCFHYMMYLLQLSRNLELEYKHAREGTLNEFTPKCRRIYFGMWNETAASSREFANEWNHERLAGEVYDSWGKLAVMRVFTETSLLEESEIEPQPLTLRTVVTDTPPEFQERCRKALLNVFPTTDRPDDEEVPRVVDAALALDRGIRRYHGSKPSRESQSAYTLAYKVIRQLGEGTDRKYIRVQRGRAGINSRLNQGALRLFARLFEEQSADGHIQKFIQYLEARGIALDDESRDKMIQQLDQMSLVEKMSDSKEAIYVESI